MHPSCWFPGLQFECEQVNQVFYQSIRQDTNHGQWYQNWIVVPWDLWRTGVIIVLGLQFSAHTNDTLCKKKKVNLHWTCFFMKTRKVSLYPQTLILTMLFLAINFSKPLKPRSTKRFPSVSHLVLSTVLPPLLIQKKMPNEYSLGAWRVWGAMGIFVHFSAPSWAVDIELQ